MGVAWGKERMLSKFMQILDKKLSYKNYVINLHKGGFSRLVSLSRFVAFVLYENAISTENLITSLLCLSVSNANKTIIIKLSKLSSHSLGRGYF